MLRAVTKQFWGWYERNRTLNITIAAFLFMWQLVHLYWLGADVIATRLIGQSYLELSSVWSTVIVLIDYTEIPAILAVSLVYISALRKQFSWKSVLFLAFLNSQWLHLFWITDEFVVREFITTTGTVLPAWLAWLAIGIDYLELPVMYDTIKQALRSLWQAHKKSSPQSLS